MKLQSLIVGLGVAVGAAVISGPAWAIPVTFHLGLGGTVSYGGGASPLVTTDGVVTSVETPAILLGITDGDLDFTTGDFTTGVPPVSPSPLFMDFFAPGGGLTVNGDIGGGSELLLAGTFGPSSFICCAAGPAGFSGLLVPTFFSPDLAVALGISDLVGGGSVAQTDIITTFTFLGIPGAGLPFSGEQTGGSVLVTAVTAVPEPSSLLFLGSGLLLIGLVAGRRLGRNRV